MNAAPAYAGQSVGIIVEGLEERNFFSPTPENKALLKYLLAYYAPRYNIRLNLVVMMGDKVALHVFDHAGRASYFIQVVFSRYVCTLNGNKRSGSMVQPGRSKPVPVLEAEHEMKALLEFAAMPTEHIIPNALQWPGLLVSPLQVGEEFDVLRPESLSRSRVYPPKVKLKVAAPKFFAHLAPDVLQRKFRRKLKELQKDRAEEKKAAGTGYVGVTAALRRKLGSRLPEAERRPPGRRKRTYFRGTDAVVERAMEVLREFWALYAACLEALRNGQTEIIWPPGTSYHHFVNGFPRIAHNPPPIPP